MRIRRRAVGAHAKPAASEAEAERVDPAGAEAWIEHMRRQSGAWAVTPEIPAGATARQILRAHRTAALRAGFGPGGEAGPYARPG